MMFVKIFIDNIISRFIKRENPMFKNRHRLCYTNWYYDQYNGGNNESSN